MSSILDALNKLEQEKAQASRESERADTDPVSIASELVGRSMLRDRVTLRVTPAGLLVSVGALAVGLVVITFAAAMMFMRPAREAAPPAESVALAPAPAALVTLETSTSPATLPPTTSTPPAEAPPPPSDSKPADAIVPSAPTAEIAPEAAIVSPPESAPAAESPKPGETESAAPAPAPESPAPIPAKKESAPKAESVAATAGLTPARSADPEVKAPAATSKPRTRVAARPAEAEASATRELPGSRPPVARNEDVRLESLPILTPMDQSRYGFIRLKVNMVKPAGDTSPQGSALITFEEESSGGERTVNRMPFYEGQRIQQSPLRLFKVGPDRVGIEDVRTGEKYQLPI